MANRGEKIMRVKTDKIKFMLFYFLLIPFLFTPTLFAQEKENDNDNPKGIISLDVKDVDIVDALKIISEASGLNVILDKDVEAKVSINLKNVPWQTALDTILKCNELTYKTQDNIIRIMSFGTLKKEEDMLPLTTKILTPNFAKAEAIQKSLAKMISTRGTIEINTATNSLIITDTQEKISKIEEILAQLDTRTPQVVIQALIVSLKLSDTFKQGMDWTTTSKDPSAAPTKHANQSLKSATSILDLYYGKTILKDWNLTSQMNLFAEDKRVKILANPRILTLDNLPAQIELTEQVPYTYLSESTQGGSVTTTQFKETGIKLYVTPHITRDKSISLNVRGEQSFVASFVGATSEPSIDSRKVETSFILKNGDTAVIGGLKKKDNTTTINKLPLLGDIPVIGKFFFSKIVKETVDTELIIFISPKVMEEDDIISERDETIFINSSNEVSLKDSETIGKKASSFIFGGPKVVIDDKKYEAVK